MGYVTNADIEARLGTAAYVQVSDDDGDGVANAVVIDEARLGAESELNSYLARRYAVPIDLAVHPELAAMLKSLALDLAEYRLRARRPPMGDDLVRRRREAVEWLDRIAEGIVELPSVAGPASNPARGKLASAKSVPRLLSREEMERH